MIILAARKLSGHDILKVSVMFFIKVKFLSRYLILLLCYFPLEPVKLKTPLAEYNDM